VSSASVVWSNTPVQFGAVDCVTRSKSATVKFRAQSPYGAFVETFGYVYRPGSATSGSPEHTEPDPDVYFTIDWSESAGGGGH
jgi:hypothetical protein